MPLAEPVPVTFPAAELAVWLLEAPQDASEEDILKVMTFEEAQNVVVDSGLSKGKTMATVAKERPVSLKFYLTPGNKSTNNIVRAAAQIMLDGMAAQKAG